MAADPASGAPDRLRRLVSWQSGRIALLGTRLTAQQMPLEARADFAVLACLEQHGDLSQAELGRLLGFDRKNLHDVVHRLEQRGQVGRTADGSDRRKVAVTITDAGRAYFADLERRAELVQQHLLLPLEPQEQRELQRLLLKVVDANPGLSA